MPKFSCKELFIKKIVCLFSFVEDLLICMFVDCPCFSYGKTNVFFFFHGMIRRWRLGKRLLSIN